MSAVFLLLSCDDPDRLPVTAPEHTLPFVPERRDVVTAPDGRWRLWVWTALPEGARGSHLDRGDGTTLVFDGHVVEDPSVPLSDSVAAGVRRRVEALGGAEDFALRTDGDWALLFGDAAGRWTGVTDVVGGCHLYHGEAGGLAAVSNRCFPVAAALGGGRLPEADPFALAWLHTAFSAPLGRGTPFEGVSLLDPDEVLCVDGGRVTTWPRRQDTDGVDMSWEEALDELAARAAQIERYPDLPFDLTLTGGKDSRAVLGALAHAGALDRVRTCYLEGSPDTADVTVGRRLAERYGLPFEMADPPLASHGHVLDSLARHNHATELMLNAWDRKGTRIRQRRGDLRGYYGEIYKSHPMKPFELGWFAVRATYGSFPFLDPHRVLTREAIGVLRRRVGRWIDGLDASGVPSGEAHHMLHRKARMARWVGHAQRFDACGVMAMNPLASRRLRNRFEALPAKDRKACRVHSELIWRADPWLWEQPFAGYRWKPHVTPAGATPGAPIPDVDGFAHSPQLAEWRRDGADLVDFLLDPAGAGTFFDVYRRKGLQRLVRRMRRKPTHRKLKALLGAAAIRLAVSRPIGALPFEMAPPADLARAAAGQ